MNPRVPPYAPNSERAVISAVLTQPNCLDYAVDALEPTDFGHISDRTVWRAVQELHRSGQAVDIPAVKDWIARNKLIETVDPDMVQQGLLLTPYVSDIAAHVRIVAQHAKLRRLIETTREISERAYDSTNDIDGFVQEAEQKLYQVTSDRTNGLVVHKLGDCVREVFSDMQAEANAKRDGKWITITTGIGSIDRIVGPLRPGKFIVIGARPSMGKTAFALNIATHVAATQRDGALIGAHFISLESGRGELTTRIIAAEGAYPAERIARSEIATNDWAKLTTVCQRVSRWPVTIDDRGGLTLPQIRSSIRRAQSLLRKVDGNGNVLQRLGLVCLDYIQLAHHSVGRSGTREQEITAIANGLLSIAKEFQLPIIALSQLNRGCEQREDKRPRLSDFRDSGAIEQAADIVGAIYRPAYYEPGNPEVENVAEFAILKSKNTKTGIVKLHFEPSWMRFRELTNDAPDEGAHWSERREAEDGNV